MEHIHSTIVLWPAKYQTLQIAFKREDCYLTASVITTFWCSWMVCQRINIQILIRIHIESYFNDSWERLYYKGSGKGITGPTFPLLRYSLSNKTGH